MAPTWPRRPFPSVKRPWRRCSSSHGLTLPASPACSHHQAARPCPACLSTRDMAARTARTLPGRCRGPGTTAGRSIKTRMATGGLAGSQSRGRVPGLKPA
ncbi:hypothetical protein BJX65DRAFT_290329 [Aspergillus insuetus]